MDLKSGARTVVLPGLTPGVQGIRFAHTGHLVYAQGDSLFAVAFDAQALEARGQPVPVLGSIFSARAFGVQSAAQFALSSTGTLVYLTDQVLAEDTLAWIDRHGQTQPVPLPPHFYALPRVSPDGQSVVLEVSTRGSAAGLWVGDLKRGTLERLRADRVGERMTALWMPDGKTITFARSVENQVRHQPANGTSDAQALFELPGFKALAGWTPDGRRLVVGDERDITVWSRENGNLQKVTTAPNEGYARLSPDGQWLAYSSEDGGVTEVYVQPFPGPGPRRRVSVEGGNFPSWGPNGRIHYLKLVRTEDGRVNDAMMEVELGGSGSAISVSAPRELFRTDPLQFQTRARDGANYDVTADGERFLMVRLGETGPQQLRIIVNWAAQLPATVRD